MNSLLPIVLSLVSMLISIASFAQGSDCYAHVKIRYPAEAMEKGIQGTVQIELVRDSLCIITSKRVVGGLGYGLDDEALKVVDDSVERCLMRGRRYCSDTLIVPIRFKL